MLYKDIFHQPHVKGQRNFILILTFTFAQIANKMKLRHFSTLFICNCNFL